MANRSRLFSIVGLTIIVRLGVLLTEKMVRLGIKLRVLRFDRAKEEQQARKLPAFAFALVFSRSGDDPRSVETI